MGGTRRLPLRVAYDGALPLQFNAALPAKAAFRWTGEEERLANELREALRRKEEQTSLRPAD